MADHNPGDYTDLYTEIQPSWVTGARISPGLGARRAEMYTVHVRVRAGGEAWPSRQGGRDDRHGWARTRLHPVRPGRRAGHPVGAARPLGGPLLLPEGRHAGLHEAGLRRP